MAHPDSVAPEGHFMNKVDDIPTDYSDDVLDKTPPKKKGCCARCLQHKVTKGILKFCFSNIGLCIIVIIYTVLGGFLFRAIELPEEKDRRNKTLYDHIAIEEERRKLAVNVVRLAWENRGQERTVTIETFKRWLDEYQVKVALAIADGYSGEAPTTDYDWSIASAILFTASILTTIGYGHVSPNSEMGRLVVILYSVLALPLMSLFIINIGSWIAGLVRIAWHKGCCYMCWRKRLVIHDEWPPPGKKGHVPKVEDPPPDSELEPGTALEMEEIKDHSDLPESDQHFQPQVQEEPVEGGQFERDMDNRNIVPASLSLLIISAYLLLGTIVFTVSEDTWTVINSLYFSWVTLTTLGFGDFVPGIKESGSLGGMFRILFAAGYIIVGLAILAMGIDLMTEVVITKMRKAKEKMKNRRRHNKEEDEDEESLLDDEDELPLIDRRAPADTGMNEVTLRPHID